MEPVGEEPARPEISRERLAGDLAAIGVRPGDDLVITAALSEVGRIRGGPPAMLRTLIDAVGPEGTVFALAFTPLFRLPLRGGRTRFVFTPDSPTYTGTLPNLMLRDPRAVRSRHPSCSFVGIGARAEEILSGHGPGSPAYGPVETLARSERGRMLLLGTVWRCPGVTTVHVAQNLLGLENRDVGRYGVLYRDPEDKLRLYVRDYVGGCSRGFGKFYDAYREAGAVSEGRVGEAPSMLARLRETLRTDLAILRRDPTFFFCDDPACLSCRRSWKHARTPWLRFLAARLRARTRPRRR